MSEPQDRCVNVVPTVRVKVEIPDDVEETVQCRVCSKGFASDLALRNHTRMEHIEEYATGDPSVWTQPTTKEQRAAKEKQRRIQAEEIRIRTERMLSSMKATSLASLASKDVSYIIIKSEDDPTPAAAPKRRREREEKEKKPVVVKKVKEAQAITGPFECLQPSSLVAEGTCHQMFFSCCDYSAHFRDEHTRRRKGLRCQVCERPLVCRQPGPLHACEVCGAGFTTTDELSEHSATAHVKLKPFECNICHKRFTQQGGVQQHMRMHTGDRPFPCTFCPKAFTQKSGLDQHLRIHTKIKPYRCVVCGKTFCQSVHLKQHMRTHTNVSPFQCGICDKRFKQSSHLNYHLKNHDPANMTDEQKIKYAELVGLISRDMVEVEIESESVEEKEYAIIEGIESYTFVEMET